MDSGLHAMFTVQESKTLASHIRMVPGQSISTWKMPGLNIRNHGSLIYPGEYRNHVHITSRQLVRIVCIFISVIMWLVLVGFWYKDLDSWDFMDGSRCFRFNDLTSRELALFWSLGIGIYGASLALMLSKFTKAKLDKLQSWVDLSVWKWRERYSRNWKDARFEWEAENNSLLYIALSSLEIVLFWIYWIFVQFVAIVCFGSGYHPLEVVGFFSLLPGRHLTFSILKSQTHHS